MTIVGGGTDYGFLVTYNSAGSAGAPPNNPGYGCAAWLGIDADLNGSIDVFLGVDMSGNSNTLGICSPGNGANNSPSSTSINSTPYRSSTVNSPATWTELGGVSPTITATGTAIHEPDAVWLGLLGVQLLLRRRRSAA